MASAWRAVLLPVRHSQAFTQPVLGESQVNLGGGLREEGHVAAPYAEDWSPQPLGLRGLHPVLHLPRQVRVEVEARLLLNLPHARQELRQRFMARHGLWRDEGWPRAKRGQKWGRCLTQCAGYLDFRQAGSFSFHPLQVLTPLAARLDGSAGWIHLIMSPKYVSPCLKERTETAPAIPRSDRPSLETIEPEGARNRFRN